jgi:hypothetical protein
MADRTAYSFPEIASMSGFVNGIRFAPWGSMMVAIKADTARKKPGQQWENVGDAIFVEVEIPEGHEGLRAFDGGACGENKRIYLSGGGMQLSLRKWQNKDGRDMFTMKVRLAPWTKVGGSREDVRAESTGERRADVVTKLADDEDLPF